MTQIKQTTIRQTKEVTVYYADAFGPYFITLEECKAYQNAMLERGYTPIGWTETLEVETREMDGPQSPYFEYAVI
jgi:hypothetical protein